MIGDDAGPRGARRLSRLLLVTAMVAALHAQAPTARAEPGDAAAAEALFRDGKALLARQDFPRACPKLAESFRLDPATGTLLALAICDERAGRLATAWAEYMEVVSRSRLDARPDRESAARAKASQLAPQLSSLTIVVADGADAARVVIRRNGVIVAPAWFGTAIPVDGGVVTVEATAPARRPWRTELILASSGDKRRIVVPPLERATPSSRATSDHLARESGGTGRRARASIESLSYATAVSRQQLLFISLSPPLSPTARPRRSALVRGASRLRACSRAASRSSSVLPPRARA